MLDSPARGEPGSGPPEANGASPWDRTPILSNSVRIGVLTHVLKQPLTWRILLALAAVLATTFLCLQSETRWPAMISALGVAVLLLDGPMLDQFLRRRTWARVLVALSWAGLVTSFLLHDNLKAQWGLIDDPEIAGFLGTEGRMSVADWASAMAGFREVGNPTSTWTRYRPAYYGLRITECLLWGNRPILWYAARLLLFATALAVSWTLLWRWLGSGAACMALLCLLTYDCWRDIWCRLGPSEIYAVFGVALYAAGVAGVLRQGPREAGPPEAGPASPAEQSTADRSWALILIGGVVAMGSKENFLVIVPFTWLLTAWLARQKRLSRSGLYCAVLTSLVGLFIAGVVVIGLANSGRDIYAQSTDPGDRLMRLIDGFGQLGRRPEVYLLLIGAVIILAVAFHARRRRQLHLLWPAWKRGFLAILGLLALLVSQFVFYNGQWPRHNRYDFPGLLALPFMALVVAWMIEQALGRSGERRGVSPTLGERRGVSPTWQKAFHAGVVVGLFLVAASKGFATIHEGAELNASITREFTSTLGDLVDELHADPDRPAVFVCRGLYYYEHVISLRRYLRLRQVVNPLFLQLDHEDAALWEGRQDLAKGLRKMSEHGDGQGNRLMRNRLMLAECFEPLAELPAGGSRVVIHFGASPFIFTPGPLMQWRLAQ